MKRRRLWWWRKKKRDIFCLFCYFSASTSRLLFHFWRKNYILFCNIWNEKLNWKWHTSCHLFAFIFILFHFILLLLLEQKEFSSYLLNDASRFSTFYVFWMSEWMMNDTEVFYFFSHFGLISFIFVYLNEILCFKQMRFLHVVMGLLMWFCLIKCIDFDCFGFFLTLQIILF